MSVQSRDAGDPSPHWGEREASGDDAVEKIVSDGRAAWRDCGPMNLGRWTAEGGCRYMM